MPLTTHVLDTMHGTPASGMRVELWNLDAEPPQLVRQVTLNADGRNPDGPLLDAASIRVGRWRLVFDVAAYFAARGVQLPQPPFLDRVTLDFGIAEPSQHYHVPLLCSPWSYSTYRGS
ncbi:hydroxyisourate hydrolase [Ramlibacter sp. AW1]|uniref:5-hydroxyisourate hydrolase n=1 Tax=Ramlibacter aurantiacus TaxID=2801330 RepID=A0A936ZQU0_9BURK|nr:hydroxyisourate hydrolase [Ramlibacter aurantiacus]MBL0420836.1 hydroxyisourate hydrolase [Ramlibacter aurantiacus]